MGLIYGGNMFKKIRLIKKLLKIVDAVESYFKGNKDKIEKVRKALPEIKAYVETLQKLYDKAKGEK